MEIGLFGIQSSTYHTRPGRESQGGRRGGKMGKAPGNGKRSGCKRDNPKRAAGKAPADGNTGQKGQDPRGPGADKRGGGRKKAGTGRYRPGALFCFFPACPWTPSRAAGRRKTLFLNKPASQPGSFPAGPWGSPPASRKNSHFCGPPIVSPGSEINPGPGKGLTGDPWTP